MKCLFTTAIIIFIAIINAYSEKREINPDNIFFIASDSVVRVTKNEDGGEERYLGPGDLIEVISSGKNVFKIYSEPNEISYAKDLKLIPVRKGTAGYIHDKSGIKIGDKILEYGDKVQISKIMINPDKQFYFREIKFAITYNNKETVIECFRISFLPLKKYGIIYEEGDQQKYWSNLYSYIDGIIKTHGNSKEDLLPKESPLKYFTTKVPNIHERGEVDTIHHYEYPNTLIDIFERHGDGVCFLIRFESIKKDLPLIGSSEKDAISRFGIPDEDTDTSILFHSDGYTELRFIKERSVLIKLILTVFID